MPTTKTATDTRQNLVPAASPAQPKDPAFSENYMPTIDDLRRTTPTSVVDPQDLRKAAGTRSRLSAQPSGLPPREEIAAYHLINEPELIGALIERAIYTDDERRRIADGAKSLVLGARNSRQRSGGIDSFMAEYGLSSEEGIILMCLAESLLRIPDTATADALIAEKIAGGHWDSHFGQSGSLFVNASTFGLMLTGRVVKFGEARGSGPVSSLKRLIARSGEPVIRQALKSAMKVLGNSFVAGRTIEEALTNAEPLEKRGIRFSYDMLGEGARTATDADRYFERYVTALDAIARRAGPMTGTHIDALMERPSISVKLSAIHPRFDVHSERRVIDELVPRVIDLARQAKARGLGLTIDAEEQDRLDLTLEVFGRTYLAPELDGWSGLGIAVQAYSRRAIPTLRWLRRTSDAGGRRIPVRLVKGAYWDSEIKWAQERGLADYPVFTSKVHTDVSYLAAMRFLAAEPGAFYPQFATHNAHTLAAGLVAAGSVPFEFQRLHGMGNALFETLGADGRTSRPVRVYAPVGGHEDLLAYLVRRLLENGANSSFVNRLADAQTPIADIIRDPIEQAQASAQTREQGPPRRTAVTLVRPPDLFQPARPNSSGIPLDQAIVRSDLYAEFNVDLSEGFTAEPVISGRRVLTAPERLALCPHDTRQRIGAVREATIDDVDLAVAAAVKAQDAWDKRGALKRAETLGNAALLFEANRARLMALLVREAGKTLDAALGEVREAVDFLNYYAMIARQTLVDGTRLHGPTGEDNILSYRGRGPFVAIAPWNFPLAIFTGQIAAALVAGNTVLAKPAPQTPLIGRLAVALLHEAGVPAEVLHFLPGGGGIGAALVKDRRTAGVVFTGSNDTAWAIQKALAERRGAIVPFIAETGGINAMIVDSSALPEQVVRDAVRSAFDSAGQRCSAARLLFVQTDVATRVIDMLVGATAELEIGDPMDYATDIGPVIDQSAEDRLDAHKQFMARAGRRLIDLNLPDACRSGTYVTPAIFEIDSATQLEREVFGPILHVVRYGRDALDSVVDTVNDLGFGLTLGVHTRVGAVADRIAARARVGNLYVNRHQIGATVGVQPFGGAGLSGSGPKAGGPNYIQRFTTEHVRSTDVTATGGNVQLLGLSEALANAEAE